MNVYRNVISDMIINDFKLLAHALVADKSNGSTLMGSPQKQFILTDWGKRYATLTAVDRC